MQYKFKATFCLVLPVLLSACTLFGTPDENLIHKDDVPQAVEAREQLLSQLHNWQFDGRISLVSSSEAWSGKLYWQQSEEEYVIHFDAPSGQGAMQLYGGNQGVELRLANGESYMAQDANALLKQQTDWDVPVDSLWFWIRGLPSPNLSRHITRVNTEGLITHIAQNEWQIDYDSYQSYQDYQFPRKIVIKRDDLKLRLIVTNWIVS